MKINQITLKDGEVVPCRLTVSVLVEEEFLFKVTTGLEHVLNLLVLLTNFYAVLSSK
jgi:hypothetical protein